MVLPGQHARDIMPGMESMTVQVPDPVPVAYPNGYCWCGCGERLGNPTKFFVSNHDRGAEARVVREVYGSIPNFLLAHGYGPPDRLTPPSNARSPKPGRDPRAEPG